MAEMRQAELQGPGFWQGLEDAFKWLEAARADGKLRAYGLASWSCFRLAPTESGFLSLKRVVALAERVGGPEHGFRQASNISLGALVVTLSMSLPLCDFWSACASCYV